jgi:hypothetical protein
VPLAIVRSPLVGAARRMRRPGVVSGRTRAEAG